MVSNKKALQSLQFSQREFAQVAGISTTTVKSFLDSGVLTRNDAGLLDFRQLESFSSYYLSKRNCGTLYLSFIDKPEEFESAKKLLQEKKPESYIESAGDIFLNVIKDIKTVQELAADEEERKGNTEDSVFHMETSVFERMAYQYCKNIVDTFVNAYLDLVSRVMLKLCFSEQKTRNALIAPEEADLLKSIPLGVVRDFVYYAKDEGFSDKCPLTAKLVKTYLDGGYNKLFVDKTTKKLGSLEHFMERGDITEEFLNKSGAVYEALLRNKDILRNKRDCVDRAMFLESLHGQFRMSLEKTREKDYYSLVNICLNEVSAEDIFSLSNMISSGLYHNLAVMASEPEFMAAVPDALKSVIDAAKRNSSIAVKFL